MSWTILLTVGSTVALLGAEAAKWRKGTWIFKPLAATGFILTAIASGAFRSMYGWAVLLALGFSWWGDVLLIPKSKAIFKLGILSFLCGHLAYLVAFLVRGLHLSWLASAAILVVPASLLIGRWLVPKVDASLNNAVRIYMVVLSAMLIFAFATFGKHGGYTILLGAICFYLSDLSVALDRFVKPGFQNKIWGTPLYFGAQLLLAVSVSSNQ
jgi:uncharacterized membrane protein YhhN